ncbi:MAG: hypothetical protein ABW153_15385 [Sedimenticola sp.]
MANMAGSSARLAPTINRCKVFWLSSSAWLEESPDLSESLLPAIFTSR